MSKEIEEKIREYNKNIHYPELFEALKRMMPITSNLSIMSRRQIFDLNQKLFDKMRKFIKFDESSTLITLTKLLIHSNFDIDTELPIINNNAYVQSYEELTSYKILLYTVEYLPFKYIFSIYYFQSLEKHNGFVYIENNRPKILYTEQDIYPKVFENPYGISFKEFVEMIKEAM